MKNENFEKIDVVLVSEVEATNEQIRKTSSLITAAISCAFLYLGMATLGKSNAVENLPDTLIGKAVGNFSTTVASTIDDDSMLGDIVNKSADVLDNLEQAIMNTDATQDQVKGRGK